MHSTPVSPTEASFSKNLEKSEQQEKIEKAKLASVTRSRSTQTSSLPSDLPPSLAAQIITVSSPRDILSAYLAGNDRRLRRLLCRYTNQIQFGCKNVDCLVPTCLTCRLRKSKTPLRKYTDTSARALAAHLVEEYGEHGLCHSEPVVPWYETPGSRPRARITETRSRATEQAKESANGHPVGAVNGHLHHSRPGTQPPQTKKGNHDSLKPTDVPRTEDQVLKSSDSSPKFLFEEPNNISHSPAETHEVQPAKRDPKSFTQAIFDTFRLRSLWTTLPLQTNTVTSCMLHHSKIDASFAEQKDSRADLQTTPEKATYQNGSFPNSSESQNTSGGQEFQPEVEHVKVTTKSSDNHVSLALGGSKSGDNSKHKVELDDIPNQSHTLPSFSNEKLSNAAVENQILAEDSNVRVNLPSAISMNETGDREHEAEDESPGVQVAPLLSRDFLTYFACCENGLLRSRSGFRSDQRLAASHLQLVRNSVFFCLRDSRRLLDSVEDWHKVSNSTDTYDRNEFDSKAIRLGILTIAHVMPIREIFRFLRLGLADAYNHPAKGRLTLTKQRKDSNLATSHTTDDDGEEKDEHGNWLSDEDVARLCAFGLLFLEYKFGSLKKVKLKGIGSARDASLPLGFLHIRSTFTRVFPEYHLAHLKDPEILKGLSVPTHHGPSYRDIVNHVTDLIDYFDDYDAGRLFSRIVDIVAARHALSEMNKARQTLSSRAERSKTWSSVPNMIAKYLENYKGKTEGGFALMTATILTIEWTKLLFSKQWDGNAIVRRASSLGGCLQLLQAIFTTGNREEVDISQFYIPLIADRLNMVEAPVEWLTFRSNNKTVHLLSYSFLFRPEVLVTSFRAINYSKMARAATDARTVQKDVREFTENSRYPQRSNTAMLTALRPHMANNFVITVRRDNLLEEAIDQVWRRQRRELMRPLKVRIGINEGEEGLDIGGIQLEFFRLLFAQALDVKYSMFTIDERTRMTWFQPGSLEPLYKFEMLGVYMSLAVYNSITLPVTFPLAFYRKLLGLKVKKIQHIADGWPDLTAGLQKMLDWTDGDVSDVFARTYEFSYEAFGKRVDIDMKKFDKHTPWPPSERRKGKEKLKTASFELPPDSQAEAENLMLSSSRRASLLPDDVDGDDAPEDEAPFVTNANRAEYVKDYVLWLTHRSVERQYKAFADGFYTCLDRTALSIFTPEALKTVIEGHTVIDIDELEAATTYEDGYTKASPTIQDFWHVVRNFGPDQHRQLLEFVTASDRVPVNGIKSLQFIIQRNGTGDQRLPTSATCFGRLLLPQYSGRAVLEAKLLKAIENSDGFGML